MTDPIVTDIKTDVSKAQAEEIKLKAWYESHLFWAGAIAGAILCGAAVHFFHL